MNVRDLLVFLLAFFCGFYLLSAKANSSALLYSSQGSLTENVARKAIPLMSVKRMHRVFAEAFNAHQSEPVEERLALTGARVFTGHSFLENQGVLIKGAFVEAVLPTDKIPSDVRKVEFSGHTIAPGFIDLQLNGAGGVMFNDGLSVTTLEQMHKACLKTGVTTFLPVLVSCPESDVTLAVQAVREFRERYPFVVPGLHMEGPWLNREKKGIHHAPLIKPYSEKLFDVLKQSGDVLTKLTLAPEQVPSEVILNLSESGVLVSIGHTQASAKQAEQAFQFGAGFVTHLFNAMSGITARDPGVIGAVLHSKSIYAGIIADGYHVDWRNIALAKAMLPETLVLVTDGTAATASIETKAFMIGGTQVYVKNGRCADASGRLGGSALTMERAVRNIVRYAGISLSEALRMASLYPARALGMDQMMGYLAPGYLANAVILNNKGKVVATLSEGRLVMTSSLM